MRSTAVIRDRDSNLRGIWNNKYIQQQLRALFAAGVILIVAQPTNVRL